MKKIMVFLLCVFVYSFTLVTDASVGEIEIMVEEEQEFEFAYSKVADYVNGEFVLIGPYAKSNVDLNHITDAIEMRQIIDILSEQNYEMKEKVETENQVAHIRDLEEGVYLLEGVAGNEYQISPSLISIPQNEGEEVTYQVAVFPKIEKNEEVIETGDNVQIKWVLVFCGISLLIILCLSCVSFKTVLE